MRQISFVIGCKNFILFACNISLFFLSISTNCQNLTFLAGVQVGIPNGNFESTSGIGFGVSGQFDYKLSARFSVLGTIDGISFAEKSVSLITVPGLVVRTKVGVLTGQLGAKFNLINRTSSKLYISAEMKITHPKFTTYI